MREEGENRRKKNKIDSIIDMFAHFNHLNGFFLHLCDPEFFFHFIDVCFLCDSCSLWLYLPLESFSIFVFRVEILKALPCQHRKKGKIYVCMYVCAYSESITIATSFLIIRDVDTHYRLSDTANSQFELDYFEKSKLTFSNAFGARTRKERERENMLDILYATAPKYIVYHCRTKRHVVCSEWKLTNVRKQ